MPYAGPYPRKRDSVSCSCPYLRQEPVLKIFTFLIHLSSVVASDELHCSSVVGSAIEIVVDPVFVI